MTDRDHHHQEESISVDDALEIKEETKKTNDPVLSPSPAEAQQAQQQQQQQQQQPGFEGLHIQLQKNKYKVVFIGDEKVGKTSILSRYVEDSYTKSHEATIGVDYHTRRVVYRGSTNATSVASSKAHAAAIAAANKKKKAAAAAKHQKEIQQQQQQHHHENNHEQEKEKAGGIVGLLQGSMASIASSVASELLTPQELLDELITLEESSRDGSKNSGAGGANGKTSASPAHHQPHQPVPVRLQLWDTAGKDRFRSMVPQYLKDCAVAVVVYDVTNRETYDHALSWIRLAENNDIEGGIGDEAGGEIGGDQHQHHHVEESKNHGSSGVINFNRSTIVFLVAHKVDAMSATGGQIRREVSREEGLELAAQEQCYYVECSSRAGYNIRKLFHQIAAALYTDIILPTMQS